MSKLGSAGRGDCPWPTLAVATGCLLALAVVLFVLPAATYTAKFSHDIFSYFDAMHRMGMGQSPHVDFHTPIGGLAYGLPYLGYLALDQFGGALEFGSAAMLAILLPLAAVALHGRAPTGPGLLLLCALFALVTVPWPLEQSGLVSTPVGHYNRWGWALLTALLLFGLPLTGRDGKGQGTFRRKLDSATIAALLSLLFFVKATCFAVGLVFVLLFGVALGRFRRTGAWGLVVFLFVVLGVQGAGGWVDDYLRDLLRTFAVVAEPGAEAQDEPPSIQGVLYATFSTLGLTVMACGVAGLAKRLQLQDLLFAAYILASCVLLATQNSSRSERPIRSVGPIYLDGGSLSPRLHPSAAGHGRLVDIPAARILPPVAGDRGVPHGRPWRLPWLHIRAAAHGRSLVRRAGGRQRF